MVESNKENQVLELKNGRKLGYAECGDLNGKPIFQFHGHPGSRLEIRFFGEKPKEYGVHIISVDRPGFGLSDFQPSYLIIDQFKKQMIDSKKKIKIIKKRIK